ncbi:Gfo/Idh/MocA family protein [Bacteroidetes bacterium endosymbiont of Geopemphigus sp.]|uniref:Gfo/Idh/MocA family protein n=1 Tax=Bacteroidetes bacterium endosymbiont of Geopemphigus sp. TaxID=2047937 RepID=UPI000CD03F09|nr:Gfo/Idh/MocA family oxidoreductase [Bacteroidetes bacterium endosymbiont of Geopemphigus sp.]
MLKIGVLGAGHLGKIHLKLLHSSSRYELMGFYDPLSDEMAPLAEEFQCKIYESPQELIDAVDVVDIVTPTEFHYNSALQALSNGKHFFIEKPLVSALEQAQELLSLSESKGILAQVGHVERFNPAFLAVKEAITAPMFIESHRLAEFNPRGLDVPVISDLMIHDLDIILSLVSSEISHISASGVAVISNTPDIASVRINFQNDCVANLTTSRISMKNMRKSRFFQKDTYISIDFLKKSAEIIRISNAPEQSRAIVLKNSEGEEKQISFEFPYIQDSNAILSELEAFAEAIENKKPIEVSLSDGKRALEVALKIESSIRDQNNRCHL